MAKKTTAKEPGEPTPAARAKKAVAGAAGAVADALTTATEAVRERVVRPVAEAVGLSKPKKGKTTAGKMMSKKVAATPAKDGKTKGPAAKSPRAAAATDLRKNASRPARRRGR